MTPENGRGKPRAAGTMIPKVYSYLRISSADQRNGHGIQRQSEAAAEYARKHGIELDEGTGMEDSGRSAFYGDHVEKGALGRFLKHIEAGGIARGSVLIVEDLDRLSRENTWDAQGQLSQIIGAGIRVVTTRDNQEYSRGDDENPIAPVIATLKMFLAYDESKKKSLRLRAAWKAKRDNIHKKKLSRTCPAWLIPDSEEESGYKAAPGAKETIRRIFEMKLSGQGSGKIAEALNLDPKSWKPPRKHKKQTTDGWWPSYIKTILHNRAVLGEYQPCSSSTPEENRENGRHKCRIPVGEVIENYYPAVVDSVLFHQVQQRFRENTATRKGEGKGGRTGPVNNLFSYIAKCGYCGESMQLIKRTGSSGRSYLVCNKALRGLGCSRILIRYNTGDLRNSKGEGFENLMLRYCVGIDLRDILDEEGDERAKEISNLTGDRAKCESELLEAKTVIDNLTLNMGKTTDERAVGSMLERLSKTHDRKEYLEGEIERLTGEINTLARAEDDIEGRLAAVKKLIEFFGTTRDKKDDPKRVEMRLKLREELRRFIARIDVYPEGFVKYIPEFAERTIKAMLEFDPSLKLDPGFATVSENLRQRAENPKAFPAFYIHFANGRGVKFWPKRKDQPDDGYDTNRLDELYGRTGARALSVEPEGTVVLNEILEEGIRTTEFTPTAEDVQRTTGMMKWLF
jgi:DNA invertase Pin-like site-specific DNA recombinase/chaperonin cofactor prefoldin